MVGFFNFMRCCSLPLCQIVCLALLGIGISVIVAVEVVCLLVSARMTLSLVGPLAVGAFFFGRSRLHLVSVSPSDRQVSLFHLRALSTVQTQPQCFPIEYELLLC